MARAHNPTVETYCEPELTEVFQATLLRGLVSAGRNSELIATILGLQHLALLALLEALGLPEPSSPLPRPNRHPRAWKGHEYRMLAASWLLDRPARLIAEHLGRSTSSVYRKRRFLNLPTRQKPGRSRAPAAPTHVALDVTAATSSTEIGLPASALAEAPTCETDLFPAELAEPVVALSIETDPTPLEPAEPAAAPSSAADPSTSDLAQVAAIPPQPSIVILQARAEGMVLPHDVAIRTPISERIGTAWKVRNSPTGLILQAHRSRAQTSWKTNVDAQYELGLRHLCGQRSETAAADLAVTDKSVSSVWSKIGLGRRLEIPYVDDFDPDLGEFNMQKFSYEFIPDPNMKDWYQWRNRKSRYRLSRLYRNSVGYKNAQAVP